jgi:predicted metal-dependent HD superfamily phosphohydrolase
VTDAATERELRARWAADVRSPGADDALRALLARHAEPHRRYHTARHVAHVLRAVHRLAVPAGLHDDGAARTVRLAAWFHDAVYDPRADHGANERASAELARRALDDLGEPAAVAAEVARLVELTAGHEPAADDLAGQVLVDADLDVLAAEPAGYDAYVRGVRTEYAHVDDDAWQTGRGAFLRGLLERPRLFRVVGLEPEREGRARANLAAELAALAASVDGR